MAGTSDARLMNFLNSGVGRLVAVNVVSSIVVGITVMSGGPDILPWVTLNAWPLGVLMRPWTLLTYMFVNAGLLSLLFNMLWLYCFGRLASLCVSSRMLWVAYVEGGICGGVLLTALSASGLVQRMPLMGSSAAVVSVAVMTAVVMPERRLNVLIAGSVKLIWVVAVMLLLLFLSFTGDNTGGNIAHLGGALAGIAAGMCVRLRMRRARWHHVSADSMETARPNGLTVQEEECMDRLLDKARRSGFNSLSSEEKQRLFSLSQKIHIP
ncbi:MAG: rhomboid family intramembrane serine protease [Muribaculaceae bacterium]|nr:rhomboid family intramembrane serine protease [Muribaculaceae bacterium]